MDETSLAKMLDRAATRLLLFSLSHQEANQFRDECQIHEPEKY